MYLNWLVVLLSAIDFVLFAIYRGLYTIIKLSGDYTNPIWWTLMLFTAALNVILLYKIQNSKRHFTCVNLGLVIGLVACFIISILHDKLNIICVNMFWNGLFMYDELHRDTVLYIIQTCVYIYLYNILYIIINKLRKQEDSEQC